jgi:chorismate mutase/prephenate dehydratase
MDRTRQTADTEITVPRPTDDANSEQSPNQSVSGLSLDALRSRIDEVDAQLIRLLNERAEVVVEVGKFKRDTGTPIYAPHRESAVLKKVLGMNPGPLSPRTVEAIYRELMSGSFLLERPLRIAFLGPAGSYSHQAAVSHFGSSVEHADAQDIAGVVGDVARGHADYGLVPIENTVGGGIVETLDAFRDAKPGDVTVYAEAMLRVRHNLLTAAPAAKVTKVFSKPEVFTQCKGWLARSMPRAELIASASSSRAVQTAREMLEADPECGAAAIASLLAGKLHGLHPLFESIEDDPNNITRFLVLSKHGARPSGDDKTSVIFQTADKPGALAHVLTDFEKAGVNLTHIDRRPSARETWTHVFYVEAAGHREDEKLSAALEAAAAHCIEFRILGSYPRATRLL